MEWLEIVESGKRQESEEDTSSQRRAFYKTLTLCLNVWREERIAGAGRVVEGAVNTPPPCLKVLKIKEEREVDTPPFVW